MIFCGPAFGSSGSFVFWVSGDDVSFIFNYPKHIDRATPRILQSLSITLLNLIHLLLVILHF